jgi:hypothetical protein
MLSCYLYFKVAKALLNYTPDYPVTVIAGGRQNAGNFHRADSMNGSSLQTRAIHETADSPHMVGQIWPFDVVDAQ